MSLEGRYMNVGWAGSPIAKVKFVEDGGHIVRAYSFLTSDVTAHTIVLHESERILSGELELAEGWHEVERAEDVPKVTVLELRKS